MRRHSALSAWGSSWWRKGQFFKDSRSSPGKPTESVWRDMGLQHSSQDVSRRNLKGKVDQPRENTKKSQEGPDMREKKKKRQRRLGRKCKQLGKSRQQRCKNLFAESPLKAKMWIFFLPLMKFSVPAWPRGWSHGNQQGTLYLNYSPPEQNSSHPIGKMHANFSL